MIIQNPMDYENLFSDSPSITKDYAAKILRLPTEWHISDIRLSGVENSNTAAMLKAEILLDSHQQKDTKRLFIKLSRPDSDRNGYHDMVLREAEFYRFVLSQSAPPLPIPTCYDAYLSRDTGGCVIVLDDLSGLCRTFHDEDFQNPETWFACAKCLAQFHAHFWENPILTSIDAQLLSKNELDLQFQENQNHVNRFLAEFQHILDDTTTTALRHAMGIHNRLIVKQNQPDLPNLTLCHGDSHIYNFMAFSGRDQNPVLLDFQFWGKRCGVGDLAHLTRVQFPDAFKESVQLPLLKSYHQALQNHGVSAYSWDECLLDYREAVCAMTLILVWQFCAFDVPYESWCNDLPGLVYNYQQMGCSHL